MATVPHEAAPAPRRRSSPLHRLRRVLFGESGPAAEKRRRARFESLRGAVHETVQRVRSLSAAEAEDARFLEHEFIPTIGLNDEMLHEQPPELARYYGRGLHLWQYPNQLAGYLAWLSRNARGVTSFAEIGCRWGGMFLLVSQWLRRTNPELRTLVAIDPIAPTPFVAEYFELLAAERAQHGPIATHYLQDFSTSDAAAELLGRVRPDFVYIDGDHTLPGALQDHLLVRDHAKYVVHHDVASHACPGTTQLWRALKQLEAASFEHVEFVDQYPSVGASYLGIGVLSRRG